MKQEEFDNILKEKGIIYRSCWNCNKAHKNLRSVDNIVFCLWCGRVYYKGEEVVLKSSVRKRYYTNSRKKHGK